MIRVGITGQSGFIGQYLYNSLGLYPQEFERIEFRKEFFKSKECLDEFVSNCDVIVHLAAVNRDNDPNYIYETNVVLINELIESLDRTNSRPHILFASSIQEERDNPYGKSKKLGRHLFAEWAIRRSAKFAGLIIPNVYGPFCRPFHNSVIATFSYQIIRDEKPTVVLDSSLKLIYVGELVDEILKIIRGTIVSDSILVKHSYETKVSDLLTLLFEYRAMYLMGGIIPALDNTFKLNLFNSFRSYIDVRSHYPVSFKSSVDTRGAFTEIIKAIGGGQVSFSTTKQGITRGNHYHTRKIERFAVIKGEALIQLRQIGTNDVINVHLSGNAPSFVDMPVWFTHNITNVGTDDLYTFFWINEFFDPNDADTYFETV